MSDKANTIFPNIRYHFGKPFLFQIPKEYYGHRARQVIQVSGLPANDTGFFLPEVSPARPSRNDKVTIAEQ